MRLSFIIALCLFYSYGQAQDMTALKQTLTEKQEALAISKNNWKNPLLNSLIRLPPIQDGQKGCLEMLDLVWLIIQIG